jgi:hypothetical protein
MDVHDPAHQRHHILPQTIAQVPKLGFKLPKHERLLHGFSKSYRLLTSHICHRAPTGLLNLQHTADAFETYLRLLLFPPCDFAKLKVEASRLHHVGFRPSAALLNEAKRDRYWLNRQYFDENSLNATDHVFANLTGMYGQRVPDLSHVMSGKLKKRPLSVLHNANHHAHLGNMKESTSLLCHAEDLIGGRKRLKTSLGLELTDLYHTDNDL